MIKIGSKVKFISIYAQKHNIEENVYIVEDIRKRFSISPLLKTEAKLEGSDYWYSIDLLYEI